MRPRWKIVITHEPPIAKSPFSSPFFTSRPRMKLCTMLPTNVGSIVQSFILGREVKKGDEKGLFAIGGSCVITIFQRGRIRSEERRVGKECRSRWSPDH